MINFRRASIDDAKTYASILVKSRINTYGPYLSKEMFEETCNEEKYVKEFLEFEKDRDIFIYMIEYNEQIVGVLELGKPIPRDIYKDDMEGYGELRYLHIDKDFQKLGIGSKSLEFAFAKFKELGYKKIFLWVKKMNTIAIGLYKKYYFIETEYDCEEASDLIPTMVLEKEL